MKRNIAIACVLLAALLFSFGCADNAPTDPAADPTPVPTSIVLGENVMLSDFEGVTLSVTSGDASGYWYADNDAMEGGTSSVTGFGPSATPSAGEGYFALKTNAVINTSLPIGTEDDFTAQSPGYTNTGYVTNAIIFDGPVNLTRNTGISWYHRSSSSLAMNHSVYIYDTKGRFIRTGYNSSGAVWGSTMTAFETFFLPAGASYTREDVLESVSMILWVHRVFNTVNSGNTAEIYLDSVLLEYVIN